MENKLSSSFDESLMIEWVKEMSGFGARRAGQSCRA